MSDEESLADTYIRNYPDLPPEMVEGVVKGMINGVRVAVAAGDDDSTIRERAKGVTHDRAVEWRAKGIEFDRAQMLLLAEVVMENALAAARRAEESGGLTP